MQAWNRFLVNHMQQYKSVLQKLQNLMGQSGEDSLHTALSLLQTLGELLLVLEENDSMFTDNVKVFGKKLNQAGPPHSCYKTLYLESQPLQKLELLFKEQEQRASLNNFVSATGLIKFYSLLFVQMKGAHI